MHLKGGLPPPPPVHRSIPFQLFLSAASCLPNVVHLSALAPHQLFQPPVTAFAAALEITLGLLPSQAHLREGEGTHRVIGLTLNDFGLAFRLKRCQQ